MTITPYPYQEQGMRKITHFDGRILIADDMGLGKTLQATLWIHRFKATPAIVICPAGVKYGWEREIRSLTGMSCQVIEGRKPPRRGAPLLTASVVIINYEILKKWLPRLKKMRPLTIVLDECQRIKNYNSQTYKQVYELCTGIKPNSTAATAYRPREVPHIIALSGTPMDNRPVELWTIANLLRPDYWSSFHEYVHCYCAPKKTRWGWDYRGHANLTELHAACRRTFVIRRRKKDVLHELPSMTRTTVPLEITPADRKTYDLAVKDFIRWLASINKAKAKKASKAKSLVRMGYLKRLAAEQKMPQVIRWITDYLESTDQKLIVFGLHFSVLDKLHAHFHNNSVLVTGKTKGRVRQNLINKFVHDKSVRLFIANMLAVGTGVDGLQKVCQNIAVTEIGWSPGKHAQAEGRAWRIGQKNAVGVYYLVARNTVEEDACQLIQTKQSVLDASLDGLESDTSEFDLHDLLLASLKRRARR